MEAERGLPRVPAVRQQEHQGAPLHAGGAGVCATWRCWRQGGGGGAGQRLRGASPACVAEDGSSFRPAACVRPPPPHPHAPTTSSATYSTPPSPPPGARRRGAAARRSGRASACAGTATPSPSAPTATQTSRRPRTLRRSGGRWGGARGTHHEGVAMWRQSREGRLQNASREGGASGTAGERVVADGGVGT